MRLSRTLLGFIASVFLAGCASQQSTAEIIVVDGCMVSIKGLSSIQADEISRSWNFNNDCVLITNSETDTE